MKRDELIGVFRTVNNNCKLVYASMVLFAYEDTYKYFDAIYQNCDIPKPHDDLHILLQNDELCKHAFIELYETVHRAALKELFEMTKDYCIQTQQIELLRAQSWFKFLRIVRNSFSHDVKFRFNKTDKKDLPVTWSSITIDLNMEGMVLTKGFLSREKLMELLDEVNCFVETKLQ